MEIRVDSFGRLLIPKHIRDHFGLKIGSLLHLEEQGEQIVLKPVQEKPLIEVKNGISVYTGVAMGDLNSALKVVRSDRLDHLGKL